MARSRNIKPSIMDNEELAELEPMARLLFIYLWMLADREGRLEDRPKRIAAQALPYDRNADVGAMLDQLHVAGFIVRYEAQGQACIQILGFAKHQNPHIRETASSLPGPEQGTTKDVPEHELGCLEHQPNASETASTRRHNLGSAEASPRSPDSGFLIPDSLIPDCGLGRTAPASQAPKPAKRATQIPEDFYPNETGVTYAEQRKVSLAMELQSFRNFHQAKGSTFKDWQAAWRTWCDKAVEFGRTGNAPAKQSPESFYERDQRLKAQAVASFAPGIAAKAPASFDFIEGGVKDVTAIESH